MIHFTPLTWTASHRDHYVDVHVDVPCFYYTFPIPTIFPSPCPLPVSIPTPDSAGMFRIPLPRLAACCMLLDIHSLLPPALLRCSAGPLLRCPVPPLPKCLSLPSLLHSLTRSFVVVVCLPRVSRPLCSLYGMIKLRPHRRTRSCRHRGYDVSACIFPSRDLPPIKGGKGRLRGSADLGARL
jgi:hypothetical protein